MQNELTRNSPGNASPQSSPLAQPLWTDLGLKEWNWCAGADVNLKEEEEVEGEEEAQVKNGEIIHRTRSTNNNNNNNNNNNVHL
ncbi:hypothetical protein [Thiolapillus sp.]|uniref:hypothetical protein n=1 Tax=Thiolapillus sp. TaxID=2017437 RepID=UPI0025EF672A|nr:hypothetical protein [Thiolapillus sp.]